MSTKTIKKQCSNQSFGFLHQEKRQGLEANFVHLLEGNSQEAFFRVEKTKTQVSKHEKNEHRFLCEML